MHYLIILIISISFYGCKGSDKSATLENQPPPDVVISELKGSIEPLKGPCFSGNLNIQPVSCSTLAEVGSSTSYSLNGYNSITYSQTQPTTCASVTGALSCYSEISKQATVGTVDLASYVDFSSTPIFTVNVLSKIAGGCVNTKVKSGLSLTTANAEAKDALLASLGLPVNSTYSSLSELDFQGSSQNNELLIAMSAIVQKWGSDDGSKINSVVTTLQNDFADCFFTVANLAEIRKYGNQVDYAAVKSNLVDLYAVNYSSTATPPDSSGMIDKLKDADFDGVSNALDDDTPDALTFAAVSNAEPNSSYSSNTVTIAGLDTVGTTNASFSGGILTYNNAQSASSFKAKNGDTAYFTLISGTFGVTTSASLTIGNSTSNYSVSTRIPNIAAISGTGTAGFSTNLGSTYMATPFKVSSGFSAKYLGFGENCTYSAIDLYSDNAGKPGTKLASGTMNASGFFGQTDYPISGGGTSKLTYSSAALASRYSIAANTVYWLVATKSLSCNVSTYESFTGGQAMYSNDLVNWINLGSGVHKSFLTD